LPCKTGPPATSSTTASIAAGGLLAGKASDQRSDIAVVRRLSAASPAPGDLNLVVNRYF
jgi:hypothetical protein